MILHVRVLFGLRLKGGKAKIKIKVALDLRMNDHFNYHNLFN